MMNRKTFALVLFLLLFGSVAACSKNLMPPEGLNTADVGSQLKQSKGSGSSAGSAGSPGSGFNIREQGSDFLTEENVGESARSGDFGGSGDGSSGGFSGGGGSSGRFDSQPFLGDGRGDSNNFGDEARRQNFVSTSSLKDIHFKFDKYDLDDQSRQTLRQNAAYLRTNSAAIIEIQGHCDERGTNNYNIALGERRAQSTKIYMVSQGISARRIHTISYGEEKPFCFDSNNGCWYKNRRAHFRINK